MNAHSVDGQDSRKVYTAFQEALLHYVGMTVPQLSIPVQCTQPA